jgi:hypothetical protein
MIKQWLMSIAGVLSAIAIIFMSGKRRGTQQSEAKQNEDELAAVKQTIEQNNIVQRGSGDVDSMRAKLSKRLRRK